jgi:hypothetical protein
MGMIPQLKRSKDPVFMPERNATADQVGKVVSAVNVRRVWNDPQTQADEDNSQNDLTEKINLGYANVCIVRSDSGTPHGIRATVPPDHPHAQPPAPVEESAPIKVDMSAADNPAPDTTPAKKKGKTTS